MGRRRIGPMGAQLFSQLLTDGSAPSAPASFGPRGTRDRAEFAGGVRALAAALADHGGGRWLVLSESAHAAGVAVVALAEVGGVALLPPNRQPGTLAPLRDEVRGALVDPDLARERAVLRGLPVLDPLDPPPAPARAARAIERTAPLAEFYTSGTTGDPRRVVKQVCHLEDEIRALEGLFGERLGPDARIFASVSHAHIYGLLFRVLWPLCSGRAFHDPTPLHLQELLPRAAGAPACALVTTPIQLARAAAAGRLGALRGRCRAVFSSGGSLDAETAKAVGEALGASPLEILGSTETGGIALRERAVHGESYVPFPGVRVACEGADGRLVVTSPFVSEGEPAGDGGRRFASGDRAALQADGSFRLLGRGDRTAKIGEKRLSLPAMERDLAEHPWVVEVALLARSQAGADRAHAAVVLSEAGRARLRAEGRRAVARVLTDHLSARFDRVLLPRIWRFPRELPRDARGKLPHSALEALFAERARAPIVHAETREERRVERSLEVPEDLEQLDGHFPGHPVVAGVVQLGWVMDAARGLLGRMPGVRAFEGLKFPSLLPPGARATLQVELSAAGDAFRFELVGTGRVYACGRCRIARETS